MIKEKIDNKIYFPIRITNGKQEYMCDSRGKIKYYRSKEMLNLYSPNCDAVAIYELSKVITKNGTTIKIEEA